MRNGRSFLAVAAGGCLLAGCLESPIEGIPELVPELEAGDELVWVETHGGGVLARTETTVAQYALCVLAGACSEPDTRDGCNWGTDREDHPVNCVDQGQAERWIVVRRLRGPPRGFGARR